jgi:hypothetical protein
MAIQQDEAAVVATPAGQRRRLALIGVIMTGASAALVATQPYGYLGLAVGLLGLVFFGPITLMALLRALRRAPVLVLGADGFTDRATLASAGFVPWQDVHSIDQRLFMGRGMVTVTMTDRDAFRRRRPAWRRALLRLNQVFVDADVFIPQNVLPMSTADLMHTMRARRRRAGGHPPQPRHRP